MLKAISKFTSSFASLRTEGPTGVDAQERVEDIRSAMVYELSRMDDATDCSYVRSRVVRAGDIQELWFLRSDLISALAKSLGEEAARERLKPITELFRGVIPKQYLNSAGAGPRSRAR